TRCLSDWSSDVCSSDLEPTIGVVPEQPVLLFAPVHHVVICRPAFLKAPPLGLHCLSQIIGPHISLREPAIPLARRCICLDARSEIGRASCREGVSVSGV